jgi:hypothetical protein
MNWSGIRGALAAVINPRILRPRLVVPGEHTRPFPSTGAHDVLRVDISHLDWARFKANGVTGIVIDKDNCIVSHLCAEVERRLMRVPLLCQTKPHCDTLELSLQPSWDTLLRTFGPANVLIVSNSAGTRKDSLLLQVRLFPHLLDFSLTSPPLGGIRLSEPPRPSPRPPHSETRARMRPKRPPLLPPPSPSSPFAPPLAPPPPTNIRSGHLANTITLS